MLTKTVFSVLALYQTICFMYLAEIQAAEVRHTSHMSPHARPVLVMGDHVFVTNTPADTVDVINLRSRKVIKRIPVGIDPVGLASRPDGQQVWVANHISDSVSVIDTNSKNPTYLQVVGTVQDIDPVTKSTRFDEPVGIAFASNQKAYIALSSENQIAVIDVARLRVGKRITINAQDPRAIVVRNDKLYVIPFESNNQTQLSGGTPPLDGKLKTFDAWEHSIRHNNVLSIGHVIDVIRHPSVPDRDLYVFDTENERLLEVVNNLGTLLYGLTVDSKGNVFVAQADARNDANGKSGTAKHGLKELENRAFLNQITHVQMDSQQIKSERFQLEPLPPNQPKKNMGLATPFALQISEDDSVLIASAASSDMVFTLDARTGAILGRVEVGSVPRGIALESETNGRAKRAWVLNAVSNTVSLLDLDDLNNPMVLDDITLEDPTDPTIKRGRMMFNTASASTTGTFSCASCHPDGHTDQLLWVLNTPVVTGGNQIMPRSTMPIRGLRDTEPYHWDGIPGDPYGGNNSFSIHKSVEPNSDVKDPVTSTRHLIDGGLANTMMTVGDETINDSGQPGELSGADREAMAKFILSIAYPPAQRRPYTNEVTQRARDGFELFHVHGDLQPQQNVCGDCHRMPFLVSTNTPGTGMDAPTWRGAYDRWLILPQGRLNIIDFPFYRNLAERGAPERGVWRLSWGGRPRFDPVWDMVLQQSNGYPGGYGRQVTFNRNTYSNDLTRDLIEALETSATEGALILEGVGSWINNKRTENVTLQFVDGKYRQNQDQSYEFSRDELLKATFEGRFIGTFTGHMGSQFDVYSPQPAIWTLGPIQTQRGRQRFPVLNPNKAQMAVSVRHVKESANLYVDGRKVPGELSIKGGAAIINLASVPDPGMHLLQMQNPDGLFSNDFIFYVAADKRENVGAEE
ncbi:MAG: hypothetical protein CMJ76_10750 [Planctomycetaceae bacterium]|nr:hypothetical protein [Planctomycetaceae bacterium]